MFEQSTAPASTSTSFWANLYNKGVEYLGKGFDQGLDLAKSQIGKLINADFGKDTSWASIGSGLLNYAKTNGAEILDKGGTKVITDYLIGKVTGKDVNLGAVTGYYGDIAKAVLKGDDAKATQLSLNTPDIFQRNHQKVRTPDYAPAPEQIPYSLAVQNAPSQSLTPQSALSQADRGTLAELTYLALSDGKLSKAEAKALYQAAYGDKQDPTVQVARSAAADAYYRLRADQRASQAA